MQLAEHEEEEIDRIKEESRKRRQAILEKFKAQKSQQRHEPDSEEVGTQLTVKGSAEQSSEPFPLPLVAAQNQTVRNEAADIFFTDASFSLGKSPEQSDPHAKTISGSAALGAGTPKVC